MRYVNISNDLYEYDEKQVVSTQIYSALVVDANRSDTDSEITINCTHIFINTFNVSLYNPMIFCVYTGVPFSCIGQNTLRWILRKSNCKDTPKEDLDRAFRFGDTTVNSLGVIELMLETP